MFSQQISLLNLICCYRLVAQTEIAPRIFLHWYGTSLCKVIYLKIYIIRLLSWVHCLRFLLMSGGSALLLELGRSAWPTCEKAGNDTQLYAKQLTFLLLWQDDLRWRPRAVHSGRLATCISARRGTSHVLETMDSRYFNSVFVLFFSLIAI